MNHDELSREIAEVNEEWRQEQRARELKRLSGVWEAFKVLVILGALVALFWVAKGGV